VGGRLGGWQSIRNSAQGLDSNEFSQQKQKKYERIMTQQPRKKEGVENVKMDKEFRRIVEKNLRRDLELLERLAKI